MGLMKNIAMSRDFKGFDFHLNEYDIKQLEDKLKDIDAKLKSQIIAKALRAGGKIFILEARSRAKWDRVGSGVRGVSKTSGGIKGYLAGPSTGLPNPAWLEYGTLDKYIGHGRGKGSYRVRRTHSVRGGDGEWFTLKAGRIMTKGITPRPFLQPSFDTKYPAMINKIGEVVGKEIVKNG